MKIFALVCAVVFLVAVEANPGQNGVGDETSCPKKVEQGCNSSPVAFADCSSETAQFRHSTKDLNEFLNQQLDISYKYLLLSTQFSSFIKNRPGFKSKFRSLSDRSWEKGMDLIKYITKRGGKAVLSTSTEDLNSVTLAVDEIQSMATAFDLEMKLFKKAQHIHERASHAHNPKTYDGEISHYIEEEYLEDLAKSVRQYSGFYNDLKNLYKGPGVDNSLATYLFDEYLQKA